MTIEDFIKDWFTESATAKLETIKSQTENIKQAALAVVETYYKKGGTVFFFGNGGSSADAQHFAGEMFCFFHIFDRPPLAANALTTDTSVLTSLSNDRGYDVVFSRQLEALATPKDLVFAISTSGNSVNVVKAAEVAKSRGIKVVGMTGAKPSKLSEIADITIMAQTDQTGHVQEVHTCVVHIISWIVEELLFGEEGFSNSSAAPKESKNSYHRD